MQVEKRCTKPSSPRWLFFPGPLGRGFLCLLDSWSVLRLAAMCVVFTVLAGCSSAKISDYAGRSPAFDPESFFNGFLTAHGVVKDYSGKVIRYFNADITACWDDGVGTLDEDFVFDDGELQKRVWTLTPNGDGGYRATAGDVVGAGVASWAGNAMFLKYVLRVALEDDSIDLTIDDRMYRVSDNVVINESAMSKFGFGVGDILLTIVRHPDAEVACKQS